MKQLSTLETKNKAGLGTEMRFLCAVLLPLFLMAGGCVSEDTAGKGDLALAVGGGKALQEGFPYNNEGGKERAFVDGWSMEFTKYVVVIGDVVLRDPAGGRIAGELPGPVGLDLKAGGGGDADLETILDLPAKRLDIEFSFLKASANAENANVDEDDWEHMVSEGLSYLIEGVATRDGTSIRFSLGLSVASHYYDCINGKDGTKGIAIESNKTTGAYIYAHPVHLFWDTLTTGDETLRFDAFAAVANEEGLVTEEDLLLQDLTDLRAADGQPLRDTNGDRVYYNDGGLLPPDSLNLKAFVERAARDGVHFNGVGLCRVESLE